MFRVMEFNPYSTQNVGADRYMCTRRLFEDKALGVFGNSKWFNLLHKSCTQSQRMNVMCSRYFSEIWRVEIPTMPSTFIATYVVGVIYMVLELVVMIYSFVETFCSFILVEWPCWVGLGICQSARIICYGCLLVSRFSL